MLQVLLMIFITIGVVCGQTCPIYSIFKNDPSLINVLNGTFFKVVATGPNVAPCQRQTFTIEPNVNIVGGYLKSPDWCLHMTNCSSNPASFECDLVPITPVTPPTLPATQRNSIKLVWKFGTGDSLCLVYSYCRISEEGVYLLCRKQPDFDLVTLLLEGLELLGSFLQIPVQWVRVNQADCNFLNTCP